MVAARINLQQGAKRNLKPMEAKEKQEYKGKNFSQNSSKGNSNNNKAKEKEVFKGKNKLTFKELERYRKENKCFKCGEQGHSYRSCPQRNPHNEQPRASMVEAPKEEIVHDDVHIDVDHAKLEKGTLPTPTTIESSTYAIVDAYTDAIADATVVDACTNDIVDAMEVDASTDAAIDGNVNDGAIESIVHAFINAILDVVEAMGTDATVESGIDAIVDVMVVDACTYAIADATVVDACTNDIVDAMEVDASTDAAADDNVNDGETKCLVHAFIDAILDAVEAMGTDATGEDTRGMADDIVDAKEAKGTDFIVEDMRGLGEEYLTKRVLGIGSTMGNDDVAASATDTAKAGKGTELPTDRAAQLGEAMGEDFMAIVDTKEAITHDTIESCTDPTIRNTKVQIVALPPTSCEEKKRRDNLCIILDMNGLLIRRYKVFFYKGIVRSNTPDWARSKYQIVTGPNVIGKMQFEYAVKPNASTFLDALLLRAQVGLWSCMTQDNLALALSACFPRLNKQLFLDIIDQEGCREASFKLNEVFGIPPSRDNANPIFFKCLNDFWKHYTKFNSDNTLVVDDTLYKYLLNSPKTWVCPTSFEPADICESPIYLAMRHFPRERIQLATKFGAAFENGAFCIKGGADHVRKACEASLKRLGVDYIDLYYQHRVDQLVPIEETVGELKKLVEEGKVKYIGLSEASSNTIRRAHAVHPITAVQLEWSLWSRDVEEEIIPTCRELKIGIVAYSPLGRGFFSGKAICEALDATDARTVHMPRFQGENLEKNKVFYERIANLAKKHGCTPGQLALAWVLHQGEDIVPIPGTTKTTNFEENMAALKVKLSKQDIKEISAAVPASEVSGGRYGGFFERLSYQYADTPPLKG
ncbi:hypothetical protein L7F22_012990 [Adiantum nelumboides]|nr:hypothetical protein [Adiantum nelumboides]